MLPMLRPASPGFVPECWLLLLLLTGACSKPPACLGPLLRAPPPRLPPDPSFAEANQQRQVRDDVGGAPRALLDVQCLLVYLLCFFVLTLALKYVR
eukprot:gene16570-22799_t